MLGNFIKFEIQTYLDKYRIHERTLVRALQQYLGTEALCIFDLKQNQYWTQILNYSSQYKLNNKMLIKYTYYIPLKSDIENLVPII